MLTWLRARPAWAQIAVIVCVQLGAMALVSRATSDTWPQAVAWGVDMVALLYGAAWWDRWRTQQRTGRSPGRTVTIAGQVRSWALPAVATYVAAFCGLMLMAAASGRLFDGHGVVLAAIFAGVMVGVIVALYNRGLRRGPFGPTVPRKSRTRS